MSMISNFRRLLNSLMYPVSSIQNPPERIVTHNNSWIVSAQLYESITTIKVVKNETARFNAVAKIFSSKLFEPTKDQLTELQKDYETERYWLTTLSHPNIVRYYDDNGSDVFVMEYGERGDLRAIFNHIHPYKCERMARYYFMQLVDVTDYLHSNKVAHGDLKPDNIVVCSNGTLKLCDFSFASRFVDGEKMSSLHASYSTPYISPEVYHQLPFNPAAADMWSCGATLLSLATDYMWLKPTSFSGRYESFKKKDFSKEPWVRMSPELCNLIEGLLREDPDDRFTIEDVKKSPWI